MLALHSHLWRCAVTLDRRSSTIRNWEIETATLRILQSQIKLWSYYSYWGTSVAPLPWQGEPAATLLRGTVLCSSWGLKFFLVIRPRPGEVTQKILAPTAMRTQSTVITEKIDRKLNMHRAYWWIPVGRGEGILHGTLSWSLPSAMLEVSKGNKTLVWYFQRF